MELDLDVWHRLAARNFNVPSTSINLGSPFVPQPATAQHANTIEHIYRRMGAILNSSPLIPLPQGERERILVRTQPGNENVMPAWAAFLLLE